MKKGVDLIYKLNGNIYDGIDVFELSPILLSFGKLINEAHRTLYPDNPEIAINIKPFRKGSFEISIWMFGKDIVQQILTYINSDSGKNITTVLLNLGLIAQLSGVNLLELISFFKTKRLKSIDPLKSGEYRYNSDDNTSVTVSREVNSLYQNCQIQQTIYNGIAKPLELNNVNSIDSFIKNNEKKTKVVLTKEFIPAIRTYSSAQIPIANEEKLIENARTIWVHPIRANLEGGSRSWSFRIGQDTTMIANISDENFLREVETGKIRLAQIDQLLVDVIERQTIRGSNITTSYEITKVIKYVKGPEQESLLKQ